jgi:ribonuclease P protein component
MQRAVRLRKNRQFQYVYHKGRSCACRELVVLHVRNPRLQVGFSVSRKVGNSVARNRVKRRLREQFRSLMPQLKNGLYVVVAREAAAKADSRTLGASLAYLLRKQNLFKEAGQA